jgi:hypothetical protein
MGIHRDLGLCQGWHKFRKKSSEIVPLGAPLRSQSLDQLGGFDNFLLLWIQLPELPLRALP